MTAEGIREKARTLRSLLLLLITVTLGIGFSKEMSGYVISGMELAVNSVIPSSFPFMLISDFYTHYGTPELLGGVGRFMCRLFGISDSLLTAFICGNVGGFPIGAKMTAEIYAAGACEKCDAERLIPLASNPSCAFILGGVGLGMYRDLKIGIILLVSVWTSMLICSFISRTNTIKYQYHGDISRQNYSFVTSVKQSGMSCISLIAFISAFSVAVGIVKNHVKSSILSTSIITLLEVTNALKIFSNSTLLSPSIKLALSGFSLGFGGISVMMQSAVFLDGTDLGMRKYVMIKLTQGVLCGAIATLLYRLL